MANVFRFVRCDAIETKITVRRLDKPQWVTSDHIRIAKEAGLVTEHDTFIFSTNVGHCPLYVFADMLGDTFIITVEPAGTL